MTTDQQLNQPNLFDKQTVEIEKVLLYALGEFQSRGLRLAERELALDRLRGAFKRATEKFETAELSDEIIAETLRKLGAKVKQVPSFVAKHPFRVTIHESLASRAWSYFKAEIEKEKEL